MGGLGWAFNSDNRRLFSGHESMVHYSAQMAASMALTGALVAWIGKYPEAVGAVAGLVISGLVACVVELGNSWVVVWLMVCCPSGAICGASVGLVLRAVRLAK
jgi:hypothetical protein